MKRKNIAEINYDEQLKKNMSERLNGSFRYFSSVAVHESDYRKYVCWLRKCEKLGLDFCLGYIDTETDYGVLWGFSMFEMPDIGSSIAVSHCFDEMENEIITEMAKEKYVKSSFVVLSESCDMPRVSHDEKYWGKVMDIINKY